jgi:hypothetical protein
MCNAEFAQPGNLATHIRFIHTGEKPFACSYGECKKNFSTSGNLVNHIRIHTGEKPYICVHDGCKASFAQSSDLNGHARIHSGEKPFICKYDGCNASFSALFTRTVHMRIHSGKKPFVCAYEGCGTAFRTSSQRKNHQIVHSPEHAQRKKLSELRIKRALDAAGYIECFGLGDAMPPPGHYVREKYLKFDQCGGMDLEKTSGKIDFIICTFSGALIFLEVDEGQHFERPTLCEASRMTNAQASLLIGDSHLPACTWLRYNPHEYVNAYCEIVTTPSPATREAWLIDFLADKRLCDFLGLRVLYAYYDAVDLGHLGLGVVPARTLEFDYNSRLRALSFDAHLHAFDVPREIDDETADDAWEAVKDLVEEREAVARLRLQSMLTNKAKRFKRH